MLKRWMVVFLAVIFASAVALAQRTGGSFGGSRWGSGSSSSRPTATVSRPSAWRPSYRPAATRPVVYRTQPSTTHSTRIVTVPIYMDHDHRDESQEPAMPSEPWSDTEKGILAAVVLIGCVVIGSAWWLGRD